MTSFTKFFSNPLVGILGSITSIIGFFLAIWFYYAGLRSPDLTYYVNPLRTTVVEAGKTNGLKVSFAGKEVQGDVSSVQIAIWNAGKQPIKMDDILSPIQISMESNATILEATIRKTVRDVSKVEIDTSNIEKGILEISWKILEMNDGCIIQIIYAGGTENGVQIKGIVEGQKSLSIIKADERSSKPESLNEELTRLKRNISVAIMIVAAIVTVTWSLMLPALVRKISGSSGEQPKSVSRTAKIMIIMNLLIATTTIVIILANPQKTPFDF